jgi:TolB-like protein/Tfp pilus assembly protein PilF
VGFAFYRRGAKPETGIASIAVMPFVNEGGNADVEYLSDGMTETLISSLSQLPNLNVKARSSVFRYKGKETSPQTVAKDLHVQAVLNGRVVQRGDQLTLSLELIDAQTENVIWSEQYVRRQADLVSLQSEIARDVSSKLKAKLSGADERNLTKNYAVNPEAYQLYLKGRYFWNKRTDEATNKAIEYYQQAIEKDPGYAMAYVGLAESYTTSDLRLRERAAKVTPAALKALELDPTLGEPHAALANIRDTYELDYPGAEQEFKRAIELSPNYATGYHWFGEFLAMQGRFDESFAMYKKAVELEPYSLAISTDLGLAYYYARQIDRAIDHFKKIEEMDPSYVRTHFYLATVYQEKGMFPEAADEVEKGAVLSGDPPEIVAKNKSRVLKAYHTSGPKGYWQELLKLAQESQRVPPGGLAFLTARLGLRDEAFKWLDKLVELREIGRVSLKVSPEWDNLRDDPRFSELLRRTHLAQ